MSTSKNLNLERARVAVFGDFVLDRYVFGDVSRISPEAPIPVLLMKDEKSVLGGAGNVAANIKALSATPIPVGFVGACSRGDELSGHLQSLEIDTQLLYQRANRTTPVKTRFLGANQQILRVDSEVIQPPTDIEVQLLIQAAETVECDVAIVSDYGKGVLMNEACEKLIKTLRAREIPILVDPKGNDYFKYKGATALTPNLKELGEVSGKNLKGDEQISFCARKLIYDLDLDFIIATRGEDGLTLVNTDSETHMPTCAREVFDVSGAGDTLISTFAVAMASGHSIQDSCRIANAAAGLVVAKNGTATVTIQEVESALHVPSSRIGIEKISSRANARTTVNDWKAHGYTIGFTNGCFDILHPGHISLLEQSAAKCDRLIVGLNTDKSVSRLKGPTRPIVDQDSRANVLSGLSSVDLVVPFDEETPLNLITELMPDVLIKGSDYEEHEIVGAEEIKTNGGRVERVILVDGKSTTNIINKIQKSLFEKAQ